MAEQTPAKSPVRPERLAPTPVPPIPDTSSAKGEEIPTIYSHFRTGLSRHRTGLSEHRTDLSEYRTDLSMHRTDLSENRTEMSMRRTGMSIQRTRMSADRTLMSEIRTSLSMISFGFTIYQVFRKLADSGAITSGRAPGNFGGILIVLGMIILIGGIWRHVQFALQLRHLRKEMIDSQLIHGQSAYPVSVALVVAILLLIVGLLALLSIIFNISLFG
ncbi:YidH family protein [Sphingopyxis indica]|uniref:Uncharacterized membrane protein YidH, DUF202 family n=1 Tax=Sphingopyxis indica TaxID=436663 RepID=A0A239DDV2_9SPHN|nr:DUF202 domain-containing protein [Sphingopyxis indica]WOF44667.1 DUF202 domain-containing protein [Sphingopyxis indica]SNS30487.1 Uncharacterized membrane protein YidH, DUF202 family [Sphingopyxis indica]